MERTSIPRLLLLLLPLLMLLLGYAPRTTDARCSPLNETRVQEEDSANVITETKVIDGKMIGAQSYVLAETGFQGVNLTADIDAEVDGELGLQTFRYSHFVQGNGTCFEKNEWMEVAMVIRVFNSSSLEFLTSECWEKCKMNQTNLGNIKLAVLNLSAKGPSRWASKLKDCKYKNLSRPPPLEKTPTCVQEILQRPRTPVIPPTTQAQLSPVSRVVLLVVVVVVSTAAAVVVVVVVVCWRKRRQGTTVEELTSHTITVVRDNSIYEPFDQQTTVASGTVHEVENDIYEPFDYENSISEPFDQQTPAGSGIVHEVENDIYEPFDYENSISEPFDQQTAAGSGTVHEVENDIYEPFSYEPAAQGKPGVNKYYEHTEADDDTYDRLNYREDWGEKQ